MTKIHILKPKILPPLNDHTVPALDLGRPLDKFRATQRFSLAGKCFDRSLRALTIVHRLGDARWYPRNA